MGGIPPTVSQFAGCCQFKGTRSLEKERRPQKTFHDQRVSEGKPGGGERGIGEKF